jgi:hypothetical protein
MSNQPKLTSLSLRGKDVLLINKFPVTEEFIVLLEEIMIHDEPFHTMRKLLDGALDHAVLSKGDITEDLESYFFTIRLICKLIEIHADFYRRRFNTEDFPKE